MIYTREQMEQWDENAIRETLKREGREAGREEGREEIIRNLLESGTLTVRELASKTGVSESVIRRIKKKMRKG